MQYNDVLTPYVSLKTLYQGKEARHTRQHTSYDPSYSTPEQENLQKQVDSRQKGEGTSGEITCFFEGFWKAGLLS